jgi:hypothetical protein
LEHRIEGYFLALTGQSIQDPILNAQGHIQRTFRVPASGAMASMKGDIRTAITWLPRQILVEAKHRRMKSKNGSKSAPVYRLDMELVHKNEEEAKAIGFLPLFAFCFKGSPKNNLHAILKHEDYNFFIESLNGMEPSSQPCEIELRRNAKTLTILKQSLDADMSHPRSFVEGDTTYVILSWSLLDIILKRLKEKNGAIH